MQTPILHWLTVDEAVVVGGWSSRQGVLAAIRRGNLRAENINPSADPRRYEYRTTAEWVLEYVRHHKRIGEEEIGLLAGTLDMIIAEEAAMEGQRGSSTGDQEWIDDGFVLR